MQYLAHEGDTLLSWEKVRLWPTGAFEVFQEAGWIVFASPATQRTGKIQPEHLQQWRLTQRQVAQWVRGALGLKGKPRKDGTSGRLKLGNIQGDERSSALEFDAAGSVYVKSSRHTLPLAEIVALKHGQLVIDRAAIVDRVDLQPIPASKVKRTCKQPPTDLDGLETGPPEWRSQIAREAANARHDRPGGTRDRQQQIRAIWATGKYTSRDRCAEEECAALEMSFSTARKALRNTPEPKRST